MLWLVLLAACGDGRAVSTPVSGGNADNGRRAIEELGCGACHVVPGVRWPRAHVGPSLEGFAARSFIAGALPNRPDTLKAFVRDATRFVPEGAMPPIAMTGQQADDIAAYLYTLQPERGP